jgi:hypothetical protein
MAIALSRRRLGKMRWATRLAYPASLDRSTATALLDLLHRAQNEFYAGGDGWRRSLGIATSSLPNLEA